MTARLEAATKRLTPEEVEHLTQIAEFYAERREGGEGSDLKLTWVGCLIGEDKSGIEAAHRANEMRMELLEKSIAK